MDIREQSSPAEFAVVEDVVRTHTSGFAARGFTLINVTEGGTPPFVRSISFHFSNPGAGLLLDVSFFVGRRRGFTALISKPGHGRLDVGDYLDLHGQSEMSALFTSDDPGTDVRAFAEATIRRLLGLLDNELKPIIDGQTWESTPIDWQGHK
jgi:hypothetical protein